MSGKNDALAFLQGEIEKKEAHITISFEDYLDLTRKDPRRVLRNIFQLFYDMVKTYVGEGKDETPEDPESIGFVEYDCSKLFVKGSDSPFFADMLFANRFMRQQVESLRQGFQQNRIYSYEGPSGCGKSTFLNNLLRTFESYAGTKEGQVFELVWEIDPSSFQETDANTHKLIVPCPSHDYPILIIPKEQRIAFLKKMFADDEEALAAILNDKSYEWLSAEEPCTICKSIFWAALGKLKSLDKVLEMIRARPYHFDRALGEGISVFNPGDKPMMRSFEGEGIGLYFTNKQIQEQLDQIFGPEAVHYMYSLLAKTNNGIYVLMDVKSHNRGRLIELHNVISEGVHKVGSIEEPINSLFFALMNPEDEAVIKEENMESLQRRIQKNKVPFVLNPDTEVDIWHSIFGTREVDRHFLPRILMNLARVIICSRMETECQALKKWIPDIGDKYKRYCDKDGLLLRMAIYSGVIPDWLSEADRKKFVAAVRREMIAQGEKDGGKGFSGTDSTRLFQDFLSRYSGRASLISIENLVEFFTNRIDQTVRDSNIPKGFLASIRDSYDYVVLSEVKEGLYYYNENKIEKDILNYLCAVDYDLGAEIVCTYTGEKMVVTLEFLRLIASLIIGESLNEEDTLAFAKGIQAKHTAARAKDGVRMAADIKGTEFFSELLKTYKRNLKENVLKPFVKNENFRNALKAFGTPEFETFDTRLREHVMHLMEILTQKFGYTEQGAKEISVYVLDKNLDEKFPKG